MVIKYELKKVDKNSKARLGRITTPHGSFDTPVFMAVGTQGTVKTLVKEAYYTNGDNAVYMIRELEY